MVPAYDAYAPLVPNAMLYFAINSVRFVREHIFEMTF